MTTTRRTNRYHILVSEILHRLPAKSLCRLKCVCKHLNSLISNPEFINFHLRFALDVNHLFVFSNNLNDRSKICLYTSNLDDRFTRRYKKLKKVPLPIRVNQDHQFFSVGSCNGLHCIVRMPSIYLEIIVFNPSTGIYKHVQVTDLASRGTSNESILRRDKYLTNFGFGFDDVNDDYKVVRVTLDDLYDKRMKAMVYSLKTNSWRQAQNYRPSVFMEWHHTNEATVIDNHLLHWIIMTPPGELKIACFDICNEIWREDILWPYSLVIGSRLNPKLGVLDGCLYVIFVIPSTNKVDIWVMKEYKVNESWVKLFEVSNQCVVDTIYDSPRPRLRLLGYTNKSKDEILIWDGDKSFLIWFDPKNDNVKREEVILRIPSTTAANVTRIEMPSSNMVYLCNGSLVNIPGGRPLHINKGFRFTFKELFRIASRKCTKGWLR